jgi:hypothetical protein
MSIFTGQAVPSADAASALPEARTGEKADAPGVTFFRDYDTTGIRRL